MFDKEARLKRQIDKLVGDYDRNFVKMRNAKAAGKHEDAKLYEMRMEGTEVRIKEARAKLKRLQAEKK